MTRSPTDTTGDRAAREVRTRARRGGGRGRGRRTLVAVAMVAAVCGVLVAPGQASAGGGSGVLAATATPYGYSLTDMTRLLALFTTSGNQPEYYPDTPFQILYVDQALTTASFVTHGGAACEPPSPGCGLHFTQAGSYANSFKVRPGKSFFVPVDNADDSPPIVGVFPRTNKQAKAYVFDPHQLGGRNFSVSIDSHRVALGPAYVAGPVLTPPLLDGGGTHMITLGAFLAPMARGAHIVRITGGYYGDGIEETYGIAFISLDFTYKVQVVR